MTLILSSGGLALTLKRGVCPGKPERYQQRKPPPAISPTVSDRFVVQFAVLSKRPDDTVAVTYSSFPSALLAARIDVIDRL